MVCKANTQLGSTLTSLRFALPYIKRGWALPQFSCFQLFLSNVIVNFHLEMQPGMLGTREPVTPCLAAQNPQGFLIGGPPGCAWKQASPSFFHILKVRSSKKLQASEENRIEN